MEILNECLDDLCGQKFGRLTVKYIAGYRIFNGKPHIKQYSCLCDCGNQKIINRNSIVAKTTISCGCFHKENNIRKSITHGMHKSRTYRSWRSMKNRCTNPNTPNYNSYGGRGITVCERWLNSFENFLADMGERPEGTSIDRIDVNGNYEQSNCRWATPKEQSNNQTEYRNGNAKLTDKEVIAIKHLLAAGGNQAAIARMFNSSKNSINNIKKNKVYKKIKHLS
jgi:hypothetical protein